MNFAPLGSPYVVRRWDSDREIVAVHDLKMGEIFVILFHLCRNFPTVITYPEGGDDDTSDESPGFLWVPSRMKGELDRKMREGPKVTWDFVCIDLINGEESAFYRDNTRKLIVVEEVTKRYFTGSNKKSEIC